MALRVYYDPNPIYPTFYLLKGDYMFEARVFDASEANSEPSHPGWAVTP